MGASTGGGETAGVVASGAKTTGSGGDSRVEDAGDSVTTRLTGSGCGARGASCRAAGVGGCTESDKSPTGSSSEESSSSNRAGDFCRKSSGGGGFNDSSSEEKMSSFESSRDGVSSFSEGRAFFFEGVSPSSRGRFGNGDDGTIEAATASASTGAFLTRTLSRNRCASNRC